MLEFDLGIPDSVQKELIGSLRYWLMHDIAIGTKYAQEYVVTIKKQYTERISQYVFNYAWNGISSSFLNRFSIEPIIMH